MDDKVFALVKSNNQVLAPAIEIHDRPPCDAAPEPPGGGKTDDIATPHARQDNYPAGQQWPQPQPNRLDFRKLGHSTGPSDGK
jgi:hypothetical protein